MSRSDAVIVKEFGDSIVLEHVCSGRVPILEPVDLIDDGLHRKGNAAAGCDEGIGETLRREEVEIGCRDLTQKKMGLLNLIFNDTYGSGHKRITFAQKRSR
jgi:hypothetical protein